MFFQIKADLATIKLECVKYSHCSRPSFRDVHKQVMQYWQRVFTSSHVSARELSKQLDLAEIDMLQEMTVVILHNISITWDKLESIPDFTKALVLMAEAKQVKHIEQLERKLARYESKKKHSAQIESEREV